MQGFEKSIALNKELVRLLDECMSSVDWDGSLLLRVTGKEFQCLREQAQALLDQSLAHSEKTSLVDAAAQAAREQKVLVYVCMYLAEGNSMHKWEEALKNLASNSVGRPIYREECNAQQMVQQRGNLLQDGYVSVYVDPKHIMDAPKYAAKDRFGHELLTLTQGALRASNAHQFVHANQRIYQFQGKKLVLCDQEMGKES